MFDLEAFEWLRREQTWIFGFFAFGFGACLGSFLNVCIYRIPAGVSIVVPGSRCPHCGTPIRWYDNLPIIGWLRLRGKARCCGARISARYPGVELLTAILVTVVAVQNPFPLSLVWVVFVAILLVVTFIDFDYLIIPDRFSIGGTFLFLFLSILIPEIHGFRGIVAGSGYEALLEAVIGVMVGTATVAWISMVGEAILGKEAMGQGDYKLMGMIGAALGWQGALFAIFGGAFLGTMVLVPILIGQRLNRKTDGAAKDADAIPAKAEEEGGEEGDWTNQPLGFGAQVPFGPMLVAGALLYLVAMESAVDAYFRDAAEALRYLL